jgi:hypothetical protein
LAIYIDFSQKKVQLFAFTGFYTMQASQKIRFKKSKRNKEYDDESDHEDSKDVILFI